MIRPLLFLFSPNLYPASVRSIWFDFWLFMALNSMNLYRIWEYWIRKHDYKYNLFKSINRMTLELRLKSVSGSPAVLIRSFSALIHLCWWWRIRISQTDRFQTVSTYQMLPKGPSRLHSLRKAKQHLPTTKWRHHHQGFLGWVHHRSKQGILGRCKIPRM